MLLSCACISPSQCDFLRQGRYHADKGRRQRSIAKTRCSVRTSGRNWLCRKLCLIFWLTAPSQVWATPSLWGEAVDILIRAALLLPEPLPGAAPPYLAEAPGNTADLVSDFDRRASLLRQEQLCAISRALENHDDIPVPPIDDNTAALLNSHEVEGVGFVRSPGHQSEVVYFTIRIPLPLYELVTGIRDATTALKLRFTHIPLPVFPQLGPDYASVVIAPKWLPSAGMQVVVYDFRGLGGPVSSAFSWEKIAYGDCLREARRHQSTGCCVYAFGMQPLSSDASLLAVPAGILQFRSPSDPPVWFSTINARLDRPNLWNPTAATPALGTEWPVLVLHNDQQTLFSAARYPGVHTRTFLADLVERTPDTVLFIAARGNALTNVDTFGVACRDVLGVYPLTPTEDRECILFFLDARQTSGKVENILLPEREVDPTHLLQFLGLHPPPCFRVSYWPRPGHNGRLHLSEGDVVTFGYVEPFEVCHADSSQSFPVYLNQAPPKVKAPRERLRTSGPRRTWTQAPLETKAQEEPSQSAGRGRPSERVEHDRSRSRSRPDPDEAVPLTVPDSQEPAPPAPEVMDCRESETKPTQTHGDPASLAEALSSSWCLVDLGGNGDCGYRALANAFHVQSSGGQNLTAEAAQADASWLRTQVVLHVQKHAERFGDFLAKDVDIAPEDKSSSASIQEWLQKAGEQGTWIDGVALQAISEKRTTPLVVFNLDSVTKAVARFTLAPKFKHGFALAARKASPICLVLQDQHCRHLRPPAGARQLASRE